MLQLCISNYNYIYQDLLLILMLCDRRPRQCWGC